MVLMRITPQSMASRTLVILVLTFVSLLGAMAVLHDVLLRRATEYATEEILAWRLAGLVNAVAAAPASDRDEVAHALSGPDLDVHWFPESAPGEEPHFHTDWRALAGRVRDLSQFISDIRVRPGRLDADGRQLIDIAAVATFRDGSMLVVQLTAFSVISIETFLLYGYAFAIGAVLLLISGLMMRSVAAPLTWLAAAVQNLRPDQEQPQLPETGPKEVRLLARQLNAMASRAHRAEPLPISWTRLRA